jgi:hypothetical protein
MRAWISGGAVAAIALAGGACQSAPQEKEAWRPLFDGRTLEGWSPKIRGFALGDNYRDTFRVEDGAIVVSYDQYDQFGERFGHLFYDKPFGAYRLRLEYRFLDGTPADTPGWARANSGVMVYAQDPWTMGIDASFPVSVEAQLLGPAPGAERTNGNMCSPGTHVTINGELANGHCVYSRTPSPPNGKWATFEIEVSPEGEVIHRVNGAETIRYAGVQLDPDGDMADSKPLVAAAGGRTALSGGYIALQSEGAPIAFRRIEILELD